MIAARDRAPGVRRTGVALWDIVATLSVVDTGLKGHGVALYVVVAGLELIIAILSVVGGGLKGIVVAL